MKFKENSKENITRRHVLRYGIYGGMSIALPTGLLVKGCERKEDASKRPDIIFILIDALRADHMGVYGHPGNNSPVLDSIASESVIFEKTVSQAPWTQPSVASLLCSRYPSVHKVTDYGLALKSLDNRNKKVAVFSDSFTTFPEVLKRAGYSTAAFVANPFMKKSLGFSQGFDHFDSSFADNTTPGSIVSEATTNWLLKRDKTIPFFCFLHYMDVHGPYNASQAFLNPLLDKVDALEKKRLLTKKEDVNLNYLANFPAVYMNDVERHKRLSDYQEYWVARYDAGIREIDYHLGKLKTKLELLGLWQDSLLIITSDHGEALCEHGHWDHGLSVHNPELHVPLLMRWPDVFKPGKRIGKVVQLIDIMPTLIEQLGLPNVQGLQGSSLVNDIKGNGSEGNPFAIAEAVKIVSEQKAIYINDWKLIYTPQTKQVQLYNVRKDPLEQNDLACSHQNKVKQLSGILREQLVVNKQLGAEIVPAEAVLSPEEQNRLKSLGYIQ